MDAVTIACFIIAYIAAIALIVLYMRESNRYKELYYDCRKSYRLMVFNAMMLNIENDQLKAEIEEKSLKCGN